MVKICYVVTISQTIEAFFIPQLKYLADNGFDVTVVCSNDLGLQKKLGDKIRYYPIEIPRGISIVGSFLAIKSLVKFFKKENFELIQYSTPNAAFYASIAAKIVKCKFRNYHLMGFRFLGSAGIGRKILKFIEKVTCNNSTTIECVSKSNVEIGIKERLFSSSKVTVVWNGSTGGVDLSRFDFSKRDKWRKEVRSRLEYNENDFVYGFVGRITKDKGIEELLSAFFELKDDSKLLMIGNVEEDNHIDKDLLNCAYENSNIKIHDFVYDIERYYAAIDVLVLPSYREGFGNVIIEAAAVGTPAVVSNIPGPIDAIESGKTAMITTPKNVKDLMCSLKKIRTMDYVRMGEYAAFFAKENFDSKILCEKILQRKFEITK